MQKNKELDEDEINFAVHQTIDKLIFRRIAEDRSVEPYGQLKHNIANGSYLKIYISCFKTQTINIILPFRSEESLISKV